MQPETVAPSVRRLTAPNPGPMTATGTQTYLLGQEQIAVIDPGPEDAGHLEAIVAAAGGAGRISHIFVTHGHVDHTAGVPALARRTGAPVLAFGPARAGRSDYMAALANRGGIEGGEGIDPDFAPDLDLADGQTINGPDWSLQALHTPGHLSNHMCLVCETSGVVFTGDTVMGWSSTLISPPDGSVAAFLASLDRLLTVPQTLYLPGHGPAVEDGHAEVRKQRDHRHMREAQILEQLDEGPATVAGLTGSIYADIPSHLHPAAARNVLAHLVDLAERKRVDLPSGPLSTAIWELR